MTAAASARPVPLPSELTVEFWEAARRHVLVRPVCHGCGNSFFVPQIACPSCLSQDWGYAPSSGRGAVYSATVVHRAPYPGLTTPYHVAIVDLEEGWSMLSNLIVGSSEAVAIGTPVEVAWEELEGGASLPVFRPVGVAR